MYIYQPENGELTISNEHPIGRDSKFIPSSNVSFRRLASIAYNTSAEPDRILQTVPPMVRPDGIALIDSEKDFPDFEVPIMQNKYAVRRIHLISKHQLVNREYSFLSLAKLFFDYILLL